MGMGRARKFSSSCSEASEGPPSARAEGASSKLPISRSQLPGRATHFLNILFPDFKAILLYIQIKNFALVAARRGKIRRSVFVALPVIVAVGMAVDRKIHPVFIHQHVVIVFIAL